MLEYFIATTMAGIVDGDGPLDEMHNEKQDEEVQSDNVKHENTALADTLRAIVQCSAPGCINKAHFHCPHCNRDFAKKSNVHKHIKNGQCLVLKNMKKANEEPTNAEVQPQAAVEQVVVEQPRIGQKQDLGEEMPNETAHSKKAKKRKATDEVEEYVLKVLYYTDEGEEKEWVPNNVKCNKATAHNKCEFVCGRFQDRFIYDKYGKQTLRKRAFKCTVHGDKSKVYGEVTLLDDEVLEELRNVCKVRDDLFVTTPLLVFGQSCVTLDLGLYAYMTYVDSGHNMARAHRAVEQLWLSQHLCQSLQNPKKQRRCDDKENFFSRKVLEVLFGGLSKWFNERPIVDVDFLSEGRCLRWDASYGVAKNIGVHDHKRWVKLVYCLGSILGAGGVVLDSRFLGSENTEALQSCFKAVFKKLTDAPQFLFFDDVKKWRQLVFEWISEKWPDAKPDFGQDVEHWKWLMMAHVEESHPDYGMLVKDLGKVVARLLCYRFEPEIGMYKSTDELREDLRTIFKTYQKVHSKQVARGAKFVKVAEFSLCKEIAKYCENESLTFDLTKVKTASTQNGVLAFVDAKKTWETMLNEDEEYFDALLASSRCVNAGMVPGTNPNEGWHSTFEANVHFKGRKGMVLADRELTTCKNFYNHATITTQHVPDARGGKWPNPVSDLYGNLQSPRMKKKRVMRVDSRAELLRKQISILNGHMSTWLELLSAVASFKEDEVSLDKLKANGFKVRLSNRQTLSDEEKQCIMDSLKALNDDGPTIMGRYQKVCRWLARGPLNGTRSELKVAEFIRSLVTQALQKQKQKVAVQTGIATSDMRGPLDKYDTLLDDCNNVLEQMQSPMHDLLSERSSELQSSDDDDDDDNDDNDKDDVGDYKAYTVSSSRRSLHLEAKPVSTNLSINSNEKLGSKEGVCEDAQIPTAKAWDRERGRPQFASDAPSLIIPSTILEAWNHAVRDDACKKKETMGFLWGPDPEEGPWTVTHLHVPSPQRQTATNCEVEDVHVCLAEGVGKHLCLLAWIHTHPGHPAFLSASDQDALYSLCVQCDGWPPKGSKRGLGVVQEWKPARGEPCDLRAFQLSDLGLQVVKQCSRIEHQQSLKPHNWHVHHEGAYNNVLNEGTDPIPFFKLQQEVAIRVVPTLASCVDGPRQWWSLNFNLVEDPFNLKAFEKRWVHAEELCFEAGYGHTGDGAKCTKPVNPPYVEYMLKVQPLGEGDVFIDFGHGSGLPCFQVAARPGPKAYGVDCQATQVARAQFMWSLFGSPKTVGFKKIDLHDIDKLQEWVASVWPAPGHRCLVWVANLIFEEELNNKLRIFFEKLDTKGVSLAICSMKPFVSPRLPRYQQKGWPYETIKSPPLPGCWNSWGNVEHHFWVATHNKNTLNINEFDFPVVEDIIDCDVDANEQVDASDSSAPCTRSKKSSVRGGAAGLSLASLLAQLHLKVVDCGISSGKEVLQCFFLTAAYFFKNGMDADAIKKKVKSLILKEPWKKFCKGLTATAERKAWSEHLNEPNSKGGEQLLVLISHLLGEPVVMISLTNGLVVRLYDGTLNEAQEPIVRDGGLDNGCIYFWTKTREKPNSKPAKKQPKKEKRKKVPYTEMKHPIFFWQDAGGGHYVALVRIPR